MSSIIQFKKRVSGAAGAPASLKSAEPAYNMVDDTLYVGHGDDGSGNATSVKVVGGSGAFVDKTSNQTIAGVKTFSDSPRGPDPTANDELTTKQYVDAAVAGGGTTYTAGDGLDLTGTEFSADATIARLASPTFTGTPAAPTPAGGTSTTQIATTAFVQAALDTLVDTAPGTLDTLNELAAALGDDANFSATVNTALAARLQSANNLSDLADAAAARTNLGLGSMAVQAAGAVNITGGTIGSGVTLNADIDGGTF